MASVHVRSLSAAVKFHYLLYFRYATTNERMKEKTLYVSLEILQQRKKPYRIHAIYVLPTGKWQAISAVYVDVCDSSYSFAKTYGF